MNFLKDIKREPSLFFTFLLCNSPESVVRTSKISGFDSAHQKILKFLNLVYIKSYGIS